MASINLFGRAYSLVLGIPPPNTPNVAALSRILTTAAYKDGAQGLDISGFDAEFSVTRSLKAEPPSAQIKVYNLSKDTQKEIGQHRPLVCQLQAGYQSANTTMIYFGTCSAWTKRGDGEENVDMITTIESGDGEVQFASSRLNSNTSQQGALVPIATALNVIVEALGINPGNVQQAIPALNAAGVKSIPGGALYGSAAKRLTDLLRSVNFGWSIQDGAIQILAVSAAINASESILCSQDSGMVDSPSVDSKGIVTAKMLIVPDLLPGRLVTFDTLFLQGTYKVQQTRHFGSTFGDEWYIEFQGVKYAS